MIEPNERYELIQLHSDPEADAVDVGIEGEVRQTLATSDYIYCETCKCFVDYFVYNHNIDAAGHKDCNWRFVTLVELVNCVIDCIRCDCFNRL